MVVIFSVDILSKKISYSNVLFSCIGIIVYLYMNAQEWNSACTTFFSYLCLVLTGLQSHAMYWWNLATCQQGTKKTYMKPWIARLFWSQASQMEQFSLWASYISISSALDIKYVLFVVLVHLFCQCELRLSSSLLLLISKYLLFVCVY